MVLHECGEFFHGVEDLARALNPDGVRLKIMTGRIRLLYGGKNCENDRFELMVVVARPCVKGHPMTVLTCQLRLSQI